MKQYSCVKILVLVFLFSSHFTYGQIDSILALQGPEQQLKGFLDWGTREIFWSGLKDEVRKNKLMREAREKFAINGNEKLIREAWFFTEILKVGGIRKQPPGKWEKSVVQLIHAAEIAHDRTWYYTEAECRMAAATIYFQKEQNQDGFEQVHRVNDLFDLTELDNYPEANRFFAEIGEYYYRFSDYETARYYFLKAMNAPDPWHSIYNVFNPLNTLALCYEGLEKNDSAIYYYHRAYDAASRANNFFWKGNIKGNLARVYDEMGRYDDALLLLMEDFESSKKSDEKASVFLLASRIAAIYFKKKDIKSAEKYIDYVLTYFDTSSSPDNRVSYFNSLYLLYDAQKNYKKAYGYRDSMIYYDKILSKNYDLNIIDNAKMLVEAEKYSSKIKVLTARQKVQKVRRKELIGGALLLCVVTMLLISRFRLYKNNQLKTAALQKKLVTEKLAHAATALKEFTGLLSEKNDLIEKFRASIEEMNQLEMEDDRISVINRLANASILTDDDWHRFSELFEKVYPEFFIRLKEKMPDLSPGDTRMMALTKLKLSQKEMAAILGIGYDAVRKARQRLREKIRVSAGITIEELAEIV